MTQEDKELLLKDLCARLPYGVKILHEGWNFEWDDELSTVERVVGIDDKFIYTKVVNTHNSEEYRDDKWPVDTFDDKLFLRPMSSMTEEEKKEFNKVVYDSMNIDNISSSVYVTDWLYSKHLDVHGLIPKGLAIEVTEENNPYKN